MIWLRSLCDDDDIESISSRSASSPAPLIPLQTRIWDLLHLPPSRNPHIACFLKFPTSSRGKGVIVGRYAILLTDNLIKHHATEWKPNNPKQDCGPVRKGSFPPFLARRNPGVRRRPAPRNAGVWLSNWHDHPHYSRAIIVPHPPVGKRARRGETGFSKYRCSLVSLSLSLLSFVLPAPNTRTIRAALIPGYVIVIK